MRKVQNTMEGLGTVSVQRAVVAMVRSDICWRWIRRIIGAKQCVLLVVDFE